MKLHGFTFALFPAYNEEMLSCWRPLEVSFCELCVDFHLFYKYLARRARRSRFRATSCDMVAPRGAVQTLRLLMFREQMATKPFQPL